jgi:hypothetical protein
VEHPGSGLAGEKQTAKAIVQKARENVARRRPTLGLVTADECLAACKVYKSMCIYICMHVCMYVCICVCACVRDVRDAYDNDDTCKP